MKPTSSVNIAPPIAAVEHVAAAQKAKNLEIGDAVAGEADAVPARASQPKSGRVL